MIGFVKTFSQSADHFPNMRRHGCRIKVSGNIRRSGWRYVAVLLMVKNNMFKFLYQTIIDEMIVNQVQRNIDRGGINGAQHSAE